MIAFAEIIEARLKSLLHPDQWIAALGSGLPLGFWLRRRYFAMVGTIVRERKYEASMAKTTASGERQEQIARHSGQQEHGGKDNADRKRGDECGGRNLLRAVENDLIQILVGLCLPDFD